jgi:hypothetical protein
MLWISKFSLDFQKDRLSPKIPDPRHINICLRLQVLFKRHKYKLFIALIILLPYYEKICRTNNSLQFKPIYVFFGKEEV